MASDDAATLTLSPAAIALFNSFPVETISRILKLGAESLMAVPVIERNKRLRIHRNAALVNSSWYEVSMPLLWADVALIDRLGAELLLGSRGYGRYVVTSVHMSNEDRGDNAMDALTACKVLSGLRGVRRLSLVGHPYRWAINFNVFNLPSLSSLDDLFIVRLAVVGIPDPMALSSLRSLALNDCTFSANCLTPYSFFSSPSLRSLIIEDRLSVSNPDQICDDLSRLLSSIGDHVERVSLVHTLPSASTFASCHKLSSLCVESNPTYQFELIQAITPATSLSEVYLFAAQENIMTRQIEEWIARLLKLVSCPIFTKLNTLGLMWHPVPRGPKDVVGAQELREKLERYGVRLILA